MAIMTSGLAERPTSVLVPRSSRLSGYLADGLGSTMAVVDTPGAVQKSHTYDVYGKRTATGTLANELIDPNRSRPVGGGAQ